VQGYAPNAVQLTGTDGSQLANHHMVFQYNADGNGRFNAVTNTGHEISVNHANYATNTGALGGKGASEYAKFNPNFIKTADGLVTLFESSENGIFFGEAGEITIESVGLTYARGTYIIQKDNAYGNITFIGNGVLAIRQLINGNWQVWKRGAYTADLANYLPLSGGNIHSASSIPLEFESDASNYVQLGFKLSDGSKRYFGISKDTGTLMYHVPSVDIYPLLHSGNVGDYALVKKGGVAQELTAYDNVILTLASTYANYPLLKFMGTDGALGHLGFNGIGNPVYAEPNGTSHTLHHDGNSAKVLVSQTPLTAEGSVRVW
jgi:hypothetical protein